MIQRNLKRRPFIAFEERKKEKLFKLFTNFKFKFSIAKDFTN